MHRTVFPPRQKVRYLSSDVLPKRLPLVFLIPYVLALKNRNFQTVLFVENIEYTYGVRFHG